MREGKGGEGKEERREAERREEDEAEAEANRCRCMISVPEITHTLGHYASVVQNAPSDFLANAESPRKRKTRSKLHSSSAKNYASAAHSQIPSKLLANPHSQIHLQPAKRAPTQMEVRTTICTLLLAAPALL